MSSAASAVLLLLTLVHSSLAQPFGIQYKTTKTVTTQFGKLEGRIVNLNIPGLGPVEEYLGVPYASPPLGQKRFMLPNSAAKWSQTKDATKLPPACVQMFPNSMTSGQAEAHKWMPESYWRHLQRMRSLFLRNHSEDCLYLNLYVPERKGNSPMAPLPVLVLVHGGSFAWGTGNAYNASVLASYGQIIVVTVNYRLGVFGFLSAGYMAPSCRGNWALGDIAAALEFLRQTVQDFNGDKNKITLLGWDTGAALVNLLMSSPVSAPSNARSFQRAILLGGSALSSWAMVKNPAEVFSYVAEGLNCPPGAQKGAAKRPLQPQDAWQWKAETESLLQDMTDCIGLASVDNATRIARNIEPPTYLNVFGPTVDGSMVINDPKHNLEQYSDLFRGLDLMVGLTRLEASHLMSNQDLREGLDRRKRDQIYRTLVTNLFQYHRNEIMSAVEDEYTDWQSPTMHQASNVRKAVLQALGDGLFVAPAVRLARLHSRPKRPFNPESGSFLDMGNAPDDKPSTEKRGSTFMYVFAGHESKNFERGHMSESTHNEDLPYLLGYPLLESGALEHMLYNHSYTNADRTLSEAMMRYISNFVKSGDPNRPLPLRSQFGDERVSEKLSKLDWPQFEADTREAYVEIGDNPMRDSFYRAHEVAFWNKFLPSLEKAGQTEANEKHHQFPQNSSYYGVVKPMEKFPPFVPPPLPPTPMSPALQAKLQEEKIKAQQKANDAASTVMVTTPSSQPVLQESYSTILSVTVAVGCALLTLNILIFAGIYHQWDKHKRFRKRTDNHHHSHTHVSHYDPSASVSLPTPALHSSINSGGGGGGMMLNSSPAGVSSGLGPLATPSPMATTPYGLVSSPMGSQQQQLQQQQPRMPPAPPPPTANPATSGGPMPPPPPLLQSLNNGSSDGHNDMHPHMMTTTTAKFPHHHHHHQHQHPQHQQQHTSQMQMQMQPVMNEAPGTPQGLMYAEQEPLLNRSFISPTCPRHGKQATQAAQAAMAAMEEIQV